MNLDQPARRMNTQAAMAYLGVKRRTFESDWRPHLTPQREGTSVVFDRIELDQLCDSRLADARKAAAEQRDAANEPLVHNDQVNARPEQKGSSKWAKDCGASTRKKTTAGASINTSGGSAFDKAVSSVMTKRKAG